MAYLTDEMATSKVDAPQALQRVPRRRLHSSLLLLLLRRRMMTTMMTMLL